MENCFGSQINLISPPLHLLKFYTLPREFVLHRILIDNHLQINMIFFTQRFGIKKSTNAWEEKNKIQWVPMPSSMLPLALSPPYLYNSVHIDAIVSILQIGKWTLRGTRCLVAQSHTRSHGRAHVHVQKCLPCICFVILVAAAPSASTPSY